MAVKAVCPIYGHDDETPHIMCVCPFVHQFWLSMIVRHPVDTDVRHLHEYDTPTAGLSQTTCMMTHKYRGSIIVLSIIKSVEANEEMKEMISDFSKVFSASVESSSDK